MATLTEANAQVLVNRLSVDTTGHPNLTYRHLALTRGNGNSVYVVGNTYTTGEQENFLIVKYSGGTTSWTEEFNTLSDARDFGIDAEAHGNELYVVGVKSDSLGVDASIQLISMSQSNGGMNWSTTFSAPNGETAVPTQVLADDDYVYVAGTMETSVDEYGLLLLKYDRSGVLQWSAVYDSLGMKDGAAGMRLRGSTIIVTGASGSTTSSWDMIALNFNSSGTITSMTRSSNGSGSFTEAVDMAQDASNNTYVLGAASSGGINLDYKLIKYDSAFNEVWVRTWGDSLPDEPRAMEMDVQGNYVITGYTTLPNGSKGMATLKYDPNGNLLWSNVVPGGCALCSAEGLDIHTVLTSSVDTNVYVTGKMFNGSDYDYLTVSYSPSGALRWVKTYDSGIGINDEAQDIVMDDGGAIYVSGTSVSPTDTSYLTVRYSQTMAYQPTDIDSENAAFAFFENRGQLFTTDSTKADSVFYYTNAGNIQCFVGDKRLSYVLGSTDTSGQVDTLYRVDFTVGGAGTNTRAKIFEDRQAAHHLNYFLGQLERPITRVRGYNRLVQKNVYRGIDWQLYSGASGLRNYYVVSPTEDPTQIRIKYHGVDSTTVLNKKMTVHTKLGTMAIDTLVAYTIDSIGNKTFVSVNYTATGANEYGFTFGSYVTSRTLVVVQYNKNDNDEGDEDNLMWSTYLGGLSTESAEALDVDLDGNPALCGVTRSADFPSAIGLANSNSGYNVTFLSKFNSNNQLLWSTFYGGSTLAWPFLVYRHLANDIQYDDHDYSLGVQSIFVCGSAHYSDLPMPIGAFSSNGHQSQYGGGYGDMFLARFDGYSGNLEYSTYIGGENFDIAKCVLVNKRNGEVFVGGLTESSNFNYENTLSGNFYDPNGKGVIVHYDTDMNLIWSTGFGSEDLLNPMDVYEKHGAVISDMVFDEAGNLIVVGSSPFEFSYSITQPNVNSFTQGHLCTSGFVPNNAFIAKFENIPVTSKITKYNLYYYSEFGGYYSNTTSSTISDADGNLYLAGYTLGGAGMEFLQYGSGFYDNIYQGNGDVFICKFNSEGVLLWSTLLGGTGYDDITSLSSDGENLFVLGTTDVSNFPLVSYNANYYDDDMYSNTRKTFLAQFDNQTNDNWITFFGGVGYTSSGGVKVFGNNDLYICGSTTSDQASNTTTENYPLRYTSTDYKQLYLSGTQDAFIARFNLGYLMSSNNETSVSEVDNNLTIYPNPSSGMINIQPSFKVVGVVELNITNSLGQILYSGIHNNQNLKVDISELTNGIYFVSIKHQCLLYSQKFILNH